MNQIKIIRKNVKNLTLRINQFGEVKLSVPIKCPEFLIQDFLQKKGDWIRQKQKLILASAKSLAKFGDGEEVSFLGNFYVVRFFESNFEKIEIVQNELIIYFKNKDLAKVEKALECWYKKKAEEIFFPIVERYCKMLDKSVNVVRIRKMKTRWGSCNHTKKYINLNVEMIKKSHEFIEFVILHELAHLAHPNHSQKFYDYLSFYMPDWRHRAKKI